MWSATTDISSLKPITDPTTPCAFPSQEVQVDHPDLCNVLPLKKRPLTPLEYQLSKTSVETVERDRGGHRSLPLPCLSDSEDSLENISDRVGEMLLCNPKGEKEKKEDKVMQKKKREKGKQEEDDDDDDDDGITFATCSSDEDSTSWENIDPDDRDEEGHHTYSKPEIKGKSDVDNVGGADAGAVKADRWFAGLSPPKFE